MFRKLKLSYKKGGLHRIKMETMGGLKLGGGNQNRSKNRSFNKIIDN